MSNLLKRRNLDIDIDIEHFGEICDFRSLVAN